MSSIPCTTDISIRVPARTSSPYPDGVMMVSWPRPGASLSGQDLELVVAILTSLPAESVLVRDPSQSAVTTITSGSQQAVSQQIVAPQIIRDIVE